MLKYVDRQHLPGIKAVASCRVAAIEKAEAEKVQVVKGAEADAGKYLPTFLRQCQPGRFGLPDSF